MINANIKKFLLDNNISFEYVKSLYYRLLITKLDIEELKKTDKSISDNLSRIDLLYQYLFELKEEIEKVNVRYLMYNKNADCTEFENEMIEYVKEHLMD